MLLLPAVGLERAHLISTLPATEGNAPFLIRQIYQERESIDVALIGNCTLWWHVYTPELKASLEKALGRKLNVVTFGFNHFGSDLPYLILKDLVQRRTVKNLILALPKIEDFNEFPHRAAVHWWMYPHDIDSMGEISLAAHLKLFGVSFFGAPKRLLLSQNNVPKANPSDAAEHFGFNGQRWDKLVTENELRRAQLESLESQQSQPNLQPLRGGSPYLPLERDWTVYYQKIANLAKQNNIRIVFLDSPHAREFESDDETVTWGFEKHFPVSTQMIRTPFRSWKDSFPKEISDRLLMGQNFTYLGARLFTAAIAPTVAEALR